MTGKIEIEVYEYIGRNCIVFPDYAESNVNLLRFLFLEQSL